MSKILVVENSQITLWVHPERRLIHHVVKTYCFGPDFREALTKGVEAMRLHKATKWLSDHHTTGAVPREDEEWAGKVWFPWAKLAGWKHWAIVQPSKVIGRIMMERVARMYIDLGINTRMFSDADEAMTWLDEQP